MAEQVSRVIPREELSEFQRWQFNSLLEGTALASPAKEVVSAEPLIAEPLPVEEEAPAPALNEETQNSEAVTPLPTAEEIEAIEQQAYESGFQSGLLAGRSIAEEEVKQFRLLLSGFTEVCRSAEATLAEDVLDLALIVARQFVRDELVADRALMLSAIREAIAGLPPVRDTARLVLNPEDLAVVSNLLSGELPSEFWRFVSDPLLSPGSCRIESAVSSVNLGLAQRWQAILGVLGKRQRADLAWDQIPQANISNDNYPT